MKDVINIRKTLLIGVSSVAFLGELDVCAVSRAPVNQAEEQTAEMATTANLASNNTVEACVRSHNDNTQFLKKLHAGMKRSEKEYNNALDSIQRIRDSLSEAEDGSEYKTRLENILNFLDPENLSEDSFNGARNVYRKSVPDILDFIPDHEAERFMEKVRSQFDKTDSNNTESPIITNIIDFAEWCFRNTNVDASIEDGLGRSLLRCAAATNSWHIASLLLLRGADVEGVVSDARNARCKTYTLARGGTPEEFGCSHFIQAAGDGQLEMSTLLLLFGANKNQRYGYNQSALGESFRWGFSLLSDRIGDFDLTNRLLVDVNATVTNETLHWLFKDLLSPYVDNDVYNAQLIGGAVTYVSEKRLTERSYNKKDVEAVGNMTGHVPLRYEKIIKMIIEKLFGSSIKLDQNKKVTTRFDPLNGGDTTTFLNQMLAHYGLEKYSRKVKSSIAVELLKLGKWKDEIITRIVENQRSRNEKRITMIALLLNKNMISLDKRMYGGSTTIENQLKQRGFNVVKSKEKTQ